MENTEQTTRTGKPWRLIAFAGAGIVVAALVGAAIWQGNVSESRAKESEAHAARAANLQNAAQEGAAAAELMRTFVEQGDPALILEIQNHATNGIGFLTTAVAQKGKADLKDVALGGASLADGAGQVIALRQSGDVAGAAATLEAIRPAFAQFSTLLEDAIQVENQEAVSLQNSADSADDASSQLMLAAIIVAAGAGLAALVLVGRSLARRQDPETVTG